MQWLASNNGAFAEADKWLEAFETRLPKPRDRNSHWRFFASKAQSTQQMLTMMRSMGRLPPRGGGGGGSGGGHKTKKKGKKKRR